MSGLDSGAPSAGPSATLDERTQAQLQRTVQRLAQLQARRSLSALRQATVQRARARREEARRHQVLGSAVDAAGFLGWPAEEIVGLLLAGREHFGDTPTSRKLLRERARQPRGPRTKH